MIRSQSAPLSTVLFVDLIRYWSTDLILTSDYRLYIIQLSSANTTLALLSIEGRHFGTKMFFILRQTICFSCKKKTIIT